MTLYSMAEAGRKIGMTRAGVWHAVKKGLLKAEYHGPYPLISAEEIERYKQHRPTPGWKKGVPRKKRIISRNSLDNA